MRTHFEDSWFDETSDVGAGPFHAKYRDGPSTWTSGGEHYTNERTVAEPFNAFHMVAHIRSVRREFSPSLSLCLVSKTWNRCRVFHEVVSHKLKSPFVSRTDGPVFVCAVLA